MEIGSDLLILSASDVAQITASFSPSELQCLMADVFLSLTRQRLSVADKDRASIAGTQVPHRTVISMRSHKALWMPARFCPISSPDEASTSMKIVCVPQGNHGGGLPASTVVIDEETGCVKALVNATKLTALRNAAGSLLATCLCASRYPRNIVAFGAGAQIEVHLKLFLSFFTSIENCCIINRSQNERAMELVNSLGGSYPGVHFSLHVPSGADEQPVPQLALQDADLVICATSAHEPLFPSSWVKDGTQIILIGSYTPQMKEVDTELVRRAVSSPGKSRLFVDSKESCMIEAGELLEAKVCLEEMTEIGELIPSCDGGGLDLTRLEECFGRAHQLPWQEERDGHTGSVTMFKSVGVGLQDVAIARAVVERAESIGLGKKIVDYN